MKDLKNIETMNQHQKLIMIESKRHEMDEEDTLWDYITPYCISKLLRSGGDLGGVLDIPYPGTISRDLSAFLNLLYRPITMNQGRCTPVHGDTKVDATPLWGKTFAISGFNELTPCNNIPCKYDIAAGVYVLGGHTANCMVEGLTNYLISETMNGEKYNVAKKWGSSRIKIVHWKWILQCLSTWTVCDIFEDENCYFAAESDIVSKSLVNSIENENENENEYENEKENRNENINKNEIKNINKCVNDYSFDKARMLGIGTLIDKELKLKKIIEKEEDEDEKRADEKSMAQMEEVKVIEENDIETLNPEAIKKINENETDNEKLTDDSPYISVNDFNFYDSQTSHSQATSTGISCYYSDIIT
jgi:twin BRCT domain